MNFNRGPVKYTLILLSILIRITSEGVGIMSFARQGFGLRTMHKIKIF